jgi:nucleotide-binding universal stress UspA family protein
MDTSVVCGVDGSADSERALAYAAGAAAWLGARLVLAHVAESRGPVTAGEPSAAQVEAGTRLLDRAAAAAGIAGCELRVAAGRAPERLVDIADQEHAALLVVGSRGTGAFNGARRGSVSNGAVAMARCPVLIVPPEARSPGRRVAEDEAAPDDSREPRLHSHISDKLPATHPLAGTRVTCDRCETLLHLQTNSCVRTWVESGRGNFCLRCFILAAGGFARDGTSLARADSLARDFALPRRPLPVDPGDGAHGTPGQAGHEQRERREPHTLAL